MHPLSIPSPEVIDQIIDRHLDELVTVRRHLHANPELSWNEKETTNWLEARLKSYGIASTRGPRSLGLVVDIGSAAPRVAVRGDIDAIPVDEQTDLPFKSQSPGVMHACGHDAHATILLGTLVTIGELHKTGQLDSSVGIRGIFQPAEEVGQGASEMIDGGAISGIEAILACHVDPSREVGRIGLKSGIQTAFCGEVFIEVNGAGGHSARPHETNDPVYAATQLINSLYGHLPRKIDSRNPVVLSITRLEAGQTTNIIPAQVKIGGTLRALHEGAFETARETVFQIVSAIEKMTGTEIRVEIPGKVPGVINDPELIDAIAVSSSEFLGAENIDTIPASVGGEDFAFYTREIRGALVRIGCGSETAGYFDLHSPFFTIDERAIRTGIGVLVRAFLEMALRLAETGAVSKR
ncbi:MAG: amidohydrolase [Planctomycetota bacterium]